MRALFLIIFCCYLHYYLNAQSSHNLVPNPSFEKHTGCPDILGNIQYLHNWFNPCYHTPNYYHPCSPNLQFQTPGPNYGGFQYPRTGLAYCGLFLELEYKEYLTCKLNKLLIPNKSYCLGFYVSKADDAPYALDKLGIVLSSDTLVCPTNPNDALIDPTTIQNTVGNCITDTLNWTLISGSFVATGNERFLTVGVFAQDFDITYCVMTPWLWPRSYYFIDDVFLYECSDTLHVANAGTDTLICMGDSVQLGTSNFEDYYYHWSGPGIQYDSLGMPFVHPLQKTTYYLTQKDFAFNETKDSIVISVKNCEPRAFAGNDTIICFGDSVRLGSSDYSDYHYQWQNNSVQLDTNGYFWVKPTEKEQFILTQTDRYGFVSKDTITMSVNECIKPLVIPNVFTPNGDGKNDVFEIQNPGNYPLQIRIFNRWGIKIYFNKDGIFWDGTISGQAASEGVYYYVVIATSPEGKEIKYKGVVHLIR